MTEEDKINYFRTAMQLQGISMSIQVADQIIQTYEELCTLGGDFSLRDVAKIQAVINEKYNNHASKAS